jgi:hypothetical protein
MQVILVRSSIGSLGDSMMGDDGRLPPEIQCPRTGSKVQGGAATLREGA